MLTNPQPLQVARFLRISGVITIATSIIALILGLFLVETGASDFRDSVKVSNEAVEAVLETVDLVSDSTVQIQEGIDAAASGVAGVSATAVVGAGSIEEVATFLETDLPENISAIRSSMPAAIQAASAIDGTLRALRFVGVDYAPDEPFDDSLRSVESALGRLPEDLTDQAESLRDLVPVAAGLAGEADRLALALSQMADDLVGIQDVAASYDATLTKAISTIENTEASIDRSLWLLRIMMVVFAIGAVSVGLGLTVLGGFIGSVVSPYDDAIPVEARSVS
jgi:hypothetical protein